MVTTMLPPGVVPDYSQGLASEPELLPPRYTYADGTLGQGDFPQLFAPPFSLSTVPQNKMGIPRSDSVPDILGTPSEPPGSSQLDDYMVPQSPAYGLGRSDSFMSELSRISNLALGTPVGRARTMPAPSAAFSAPLPTQELADIDEHGIHSAPSAQPNPPENVLGIDISGVPDTPTRPRTSSRGFATPPAASSVPPITPIYARPGMRTVPHSVPAAFPTGPLATPEFRPPRFGSDMDIYGSFATPDPRHTGSPGGLQGTPQLEDPFLLPPHTVPHTPSHVNYEAMQHSVMMMRVASAPPPLHSPALASPLPAEHMNYPSASQSGHGTPLPLNSTTIARKHSTPYSKPLALPFSPPVNDTFYAGGMPISKSMSSLASPVSLSPMTPNIPGRQLRPSPSVTLPGENFSYSFDSDGPMATPRSRTRSSGPPPLVVSSADKLHVCHCGRRFKRMEHLKRHNRTHTQERPHKCPVESCGKSFGRSDNLTQHLKTHFRSAGLTGRVPDALMLGSPHRSRAHRNSESYNASASAAAAAAAAAAVVSQPNSEGNGVPAEPAPENELGGTYQLGSAMNQAPGAPPSSDDPSLFLDTHVFHDSPITHASP